MTDREITVRDWLAAIVCAGVAAVVALVPHFAAKIRTGNAEWLASGDDVIYLAIARPAYHGEGKLRDPYAAVQQKVPTAFSWFQFMPFTAPLKALHVPFLMVPFAWRLFGAVLTGVTLYFLVKRILPTGPIAVFAAVAIAFVWLGDAGTIGGRPIVESARLVPHYLNGTVRGPMAAEYGQYRVVSPLLNYPWLFLVLLGFAADSRSLLRTLLVGIGLGLCILIYFFFWTALVGTLGLYFLIQLARWIASRNRHALVEVRFTLCVLVIGLLVGGYQILSNSTTFADPAFRAALDRTSLGYHMPTGDPLRTHYLMAAWAFAELALGAVAFYITRNRGLGLLWLLCLCGYLLKNSAIITGLEFENYHWNFIQNSAGSLVVLISVLLLTPRLTWPIFALGVALLGFACAWREHEARTANEPVTLANSLKQVQPLAHALAALPLETTLAGPEQVNVAILDSRCGQLYQTPHTSHRSLIPDAEVHERHALNAWLTGLSVEAYAKVARDEHFSMTKSSRAEWQADAVQAVRVKIFQEIDAAGGGAILNRYGPLALLAPVAFTPTRGGAWKKLATSPDWSLWQLE